MSTVATKKNTRYRNQPSAGDGLGEAEAHGLGEGSSLSVGETAGAVRREIALDLGRWRARNRFYHQRMAEYLRFVVPVGQSVLLLGCEDGALLSKLRPSWGVGVDSCPEMIALAREAHPQHEYFLAEDYAARIDRKFDYVVLNDITGEVHDLFTLLQSIA